MVPVRAIDVRGQPADRTLQRYVDRAEIASAVSLLARHRRVVYSDTAGVSCVRTTLGTSRVTGIRFQLRADLFNSLNHTNLGGLSTNISSSNFGRLTSATSRSMQLGAKLVF